ncbi:hypothetical protein C0992_011616 [Termitomyces sp. T32_za158]|nr:hypothetical protein C0992_011616 [Termitomyces sp. T32_za158]
MAIALKIEEAIEEKAGTLTLDDSEFDEAEESGTDLSAEESVIEISDHENVVKKRSKSNNSTARSKESKDVKNAVLTKAYQTARPLENPQPCRPRNAAATEALSSITNLFNPSSVRERDEVRMTQNLHLAQLAAVQQEVRELRSHNEVLTDRIMEEIRRADRAESKVQLLESKVQLFKTFHEQSRGRRRRGSSSEDLSDHTYRHHHYRSHRYHSRTRPDPHETRHNHSTPQPSAPPHVFFGQQPPSSPGPSVFPGSLNSTKPLDTL